MNRSWNQVSVFFLLMLAVSVILYTLIDIVEFSRDSKNIALDAAFASNIAFEEINQCRQELGRFVELEAMNLQGVQIDPTAKEELEYRISNAEKNYKVLLHMAGLVTKHCDPYDLQDTKELPKQHNFISWAQTTEGERVPVLLEDDFKAIYGYLHPDAKRNAASIVAYKISTSSFAKLKLPASNGADEPRERIFPENLFVYHRINQFAISELLRADKIAELTQLIEVHLDEINGLGVGSLNSLKEVTSFIRRHASTLLHPPEGDVEIRDVALTPASVPEYTQD